MIQHSYSSSAYPFQLTADNELVSNGDDIRYVLTSDGWYVIKMAQDGGKLREEDRTVIQAARETEEVDTVLFLTAKILESASISAASHEELSQQLAAAMRAKATGKI